jgi:hypothetical protein
MRGAVLAFGSGLTALRNGGKPRFPSVTAFPFIACRTQEPDTLAEGSGAGGGTVRRIGCLTILPHLTALSLLQCL